MGRVHSRLFFVTCLDFFRCLKEPRVSPVVWLTIQSKLSRMVGLPVKAPPGVRLYQPTHDLYTCGDRSWLKAVSLFSGGHWSVLTVSRAFGSVYVCRVACRCKRLGTISLEMQWADMLSFWLAVDENHQVWPCFFFVCSSCSAWSFVQSKKAVLTHTLCLLIFGFLCAVATVHSWCPRQGLISVWLFHWCEFCTDRIQEVKLQVLKAGICACSV